MTDSRRHPLIGQAHRSRASARRYPRGTDRVRADAVEGCQRKVALTPNASEGLVLNGTQTCEDA